MNRVQSRATLSVVLLALVTWVVWKWAAADRPSAVVDVPGSQAQPLALDPSVESAERSATARVGAPSEPRELELLLARFPDDAPLSVVSVEIATQPDASPTWTVTDDAGRLRVELPALAERLVLHAVGFEPRELASLQLRPAESIALTPSSGFFGRVVDAGGRAVADVEVSLTLRKRMTQRLGAVSRAEPGVSVFESASVAASARTNPGGYYFLPCETRNPGSPLRVVARSDEHGSATLDVALPRAPELLADLVLAAPHVLVVKVVSEAGKPLAGAAVSSRDPFWRANEPTNAEGVCRIVEPTLPASIDARLEGWRRKEMKLGGAVVAPGTRVIACEPGVEFVLAEQSGARIRAIDGETRLPVRVLSGRSWATFLLRGAEVGRNSYEFDERGESWIDFTDRQGKPLDVVPDLLRVEISVEGYRKSQHEFELHAPKTLEPLEIVLEPDAGFACIRGRAMRNGQPVAGLELGLHAQRRGAAPNTVKYQRGYCDDEGRFALKFEAREPDVVIVVNPHWKRWDEFAFLGPMSVEEATSKEHVLELRPAVRVPVILRNVVRSDRYTYHVSLTDGDLSIPTTINGAPLSVESDGEAHTTMLLPEDRAASITIGFQGADSYRTNASPPVHYDPARRFEPLVFDVESLYGRVAGHVLGFAPQELAHVGVALQQHGDDAANIVPVDSAGAFSFHSVGLGSGKLLLFFEENSRTQVVAIAPVEVEGSVEGITLTRDPESLPAAAARGR